jgi:hypothetical protein
MNMKNSRRKLGGFILALLLLPVLALFSVGTAEAQGRGGGGHGGGGGFHGGGGGFAHGGHAFHGGGRFGFGGGFGYPYWGYGYPYWGGYGFGYGDYNHYVFSDSEDATNQGYSDGVKTGSEDAKKHKSDDPVRSHYYHDSGFGNFGDQYREGFDRGYADGYAGKK